MKLIGTIIPLALILSACSVPFIGRQQAALQVNAEPQSSVYIDNTHLGQTPYFDDKLKPGEITINIKQVADPQQEWQTKVNLAPGIITLVNRQFGLTQEESSYYILQLEELPGKNDTQISLVTIPDSVVVKINDQPEGFSPLSLEGITAGDHTIALSAPGYRDLSINAQVKDGYKLIVSAQLARSSGFDLKPDLEATDSALIGSDDQDLQPPDLSPTQKPSSSTATGSGQLARPYVEITETGTGWLRVRSEPNASADNEVAKVDVGQTFPFIEANNTGWYKIEYQAGQQGWISGRYADLYQ